MTLRAVCLDAAGTLIALREPVGETYARVARRFGADISAWRLGDAFGRIHAKAGAAVFPGAAAEEIPGLERAWWREVVRGTFRAADSAAKLSDFDACFEALYRRFAEPDAWRPLPGAHEGLGALRSGGLATAVVSNFDLRLHGILAGLALTPLLDTVVLPADAGAAKPDAAIFALALERLGVPADEAVYVGDDPIRDMDGARAAGLHAVDASTLATLAELPDRILGTGRPRADEERPA